MEEGQQVEAQEQEEHAEEQEEKNELAEGEQVFCLVVSSALRGRVRRSVRKRMKNTYLTSNGGD